MEEKTRFFTMRITEQQYKLLEAKAAEAGYSKKSDFVRWLLFISMSIANLIKDTNERVKRIEQKIEK